MKKHALRLFCFSGFYESIHDGVFDSEKESIMENYGKKYDDFRFTTDYNLYARNYVHAINNEIGLKLEFRNLWSPREYNFATDEIYVFITAKDLKKISSALNSETLENLIKQRFTSRDGFFSYYSNSFEEWKEKKVQDWDEIELGTLLDAWLLENETEDYCRKLDFVGYYYCFENGQYVDYEKLWDEEAEQKEKELHENELLKLENWKKSVKEFNVKE